MRECSIEGCHDPIDSRGWCSLHRGRWRRWGDPLAGGPRRRTSEETLEEVLWLRDGGASASEIAEALQVSAESLERAMHRAGRYEIAAEFQRESNWVQVVDGRHKVA